MARPREFDEAEALAKATEVFALNGYQPTSLDDLLAKMDISKSSFYATFDSKHSLFLRCLRHHASVSHKAISDLLGSTGLLEAIHQLLGMAADSTGEGADQNGCMLFSTAIELSSRDEEVARAVREALDGVEELYYGRLREAQSNGDISDDLDVRQISRLLITLSGGLTVMSRAYTDPRAVRREAEFLGQLVEHLLSLGSFGLPSPKRSLEPKRKGRA
ncbi:MAG: TetR/AcrR family transcriptional regulator [Planctomycetota bacterium]